MISTLEELLDDVFYDWGFSPNPQIRKTKQPLGFVINKTYIFEREGEYFLNYKTDEASIEEEVFRQFEKLFQAYEADPAVVKQMEEFSDQWFTSSLKNSQVFKDFIQKVK